VAVSVLIDEVLQGLLSVMDVYDRDLPKFLAELEKPAVEVAHLEGTGMAVQTEDKYLILEPVRHNSLKVQITMFPTNLPERKRASSSWRDPIQAKKITIAYKTEAVSEAINKVLNKNVPTNYGDFLKRLRKRLTEEYYENSPPEVSSF